MCSRNNMCFMCASDNNLIIIDDKIITAVTYVLPEITIIRLGILLHICSLCVEKIHLFNEFKQASVENCQRLEVKIKKELCNEDIETHQVTDTIDIKVENNKNFEEIFIKEERLEDNSTDSDGDNEKEISLNKGSNKEEYIIDNIINDSNDENSVDIEHDNSKKKKPHCPICNKYFAHFSNVSRHMKIHRDIRNFKCSVCNKSFTQACNLTRHMKTHTGSMLFICGVCNKKFSRKESLQNHMTNHTGIKEFQCKICNRSYPSSSGLNRHMQTHS